MHMNATNLELLKCYYRDRSEEAFSEIVRRHVDLVYSAALRQVRSPQLAEEVAQSVFTDLSRKAPGLAPDTILPAWLYEVTRRTAIDVVRRESRRQLHEQVAAELLAMNTADANWTNIEPLLDEAMEALDATDRAAVLLRYFQNKSLREVGQTLGTSEDAAQKRVSRAVDRLRAFFAQHGVSVGASGLAVVLSANAVQSAPVALAATISGAVSLTSFSIPTSAGTGTTLEFFRTALQFSRAKFIGAAAVVGVTTCVLILSQQRAGQLARGANSPISIPVPEQAAPLAAPSPQDAKLASDQREPDPRTLLMAVAQARRKISSGTMELHITTDLYEGGRKVSTPRQFLVQFDGPKLRFEGHAREYAYTYSADEAEQKQIAQRADSMDRESAVKAGLLEAKEAHEIIATDGATLVRYQEQDGRNGSTTVDDPAKGSARSSSFFFDPRCLGLRDTVHYRLSVENSLAYSEAKAISLAGKEMVEGVPAWHVRVLYKHDESLDFWIDAARPTRVIKQSLKSQYRSGWVVSKYDETKPGDPIPVEVNMMMANADGVPMMKTRFARSNTRYNLSLDPESFTLAGLGMTVGTPVVDIRIHRRIGYWTGIGLSEQLPAKTTAQSQPAPSMATMLAMLEKAPASDEALNAAAWIFLNTPDGPEVEKATEVMLREHTRNTNLVYLCTELARVRHQPSKPLLEAILKNNPSADVRGAACFTLATLLKDEARYGQNKEATAAADQKFERVITEFGDLKQRGSKLRDLAKPELSELRRLTLGKPAPEIEGEDLDGRPMKLSDYRGKVVVLTFWWLGYTEAPDHRKLVERMAGKPFAFVGVYGDDDLANAKAEIEQYGITWPSFRDGRGGPISTDWNIHGWPSVWVIDAQGVIRFRGLRGAELYQAVDRLLSE